MTNKSADTATSTRAIVNAPGVYSMSMESYQRDPAPEPSLSSGIAHRLITQSPLHAWFAHPRLNPNHVEEESTTFDLGACAHALLLEGEDSIAVLEFDDWRTARAKEERAKARFEGRIPVLAHKMAECRAMADVARKALHGMMFDLTLGQAERVLAWQHSDIWCRARPDWMNGVRSVLLDYKSTAGSAEPNAWIRNQMVPMGYDMQAVHYTRGNKATGGANASDFIFVVQENYPPYACSFVGLSSAMWEIAERKHDLALALWQSCMKKKRWDGYPQQIVDAEPSAWQIGEHDDLKHTFEERLELASA